MVTLETQAVDSKQNAGNWSWKQTNQADAQLLRLTNIICQCLAVNYSFIKGWLKGSHRKKYCKQDVRTEERKFL